MATPQSNIPDFDSLERPQLSNRVTKAGIYTGCSIKSLEFVEASIKDEGKSTEKHISAHHVLTLNIPGEDSALEYSTYVFDVERDPSKIKYLGKLYVNGTAVRDLTPEEQIASDMQKRRRLYLQLAMACGCSFEIASDMLKEADMRDIHDFITTVVMKKYKGVFDVKILWTNVDKSAKSNLGIQLPSYSNSIVFWPSNVITNDKGEKAIGPSRMVLSEYEAKNCMVAKYSNNFNRPSNDEPVTSNQEAVKNNASGSGEALMF